MTVDSLLSCLSSSRTQHSRVFIKSLKYFPISEFNLDLSDKFQSEYVSKYYGVKINNCHNTITLSSDRSDLLESALSRYHEILDKELEKKVLVIKIKKGV